MTRACLVFVLLAVAQAAHAGTVKGFVLDDTSGRPVSAAQVVVNADTSIFAMTDSLGAFVVARVPFGDWTLQVTAPHFDLWSGPVRVGDRDTVHLQVRMQGLPIPGSLAGIVTTDGGKKLVRHVHLDIDEAGLDGITDDEGIFWIDGLIPGSYAVRVTALGFDGLARHVFIEADRATYIAVDLPAVGRRKLSAPAPSAREPDIDTSAVIRFSVPDTSHAWNGGLPSRRPVRLEILSGDRPVRRLVFGNLPTEAYSVYWDGRDDSARPVAPGTYRYRMWIDDQVAREGDIVRR